MIKTSLAAMMVLAATGLAQAQTPGDDANAAHVSGPAGTVGAMQGIVQGLATSADDVARQQEGRSTAADGVPARTVPAAATVSGAPGTVGAAPGNDAPR